MLIFSEFFWSKASADAAAQRLRNKGYMTKVRFAFRLDGYSDWLLEVFDEG